MNSVPTNEWRRRARLSTRYMVFGSLLVVAGWGLVMSRLVGHATVVGFALAFAGVPLLFLAYRELPGIRR